MEAIDEAGHRPKPKRVTGVSGGAASAAAWIACRESALFENMEDALSEEESNVNWDLRGEDGLTPHQRLYRGVVEVTFDEDSHRAIATGPVFQVTLAHPPDSGWPKAAGALAAAAYEAELHTKNSPHLSWAEKVGLTTRRVDARQAARDGRLVDLICAAAAIPPVFEPPLWDGRPVIDSGMADQAPMPDPDRGETLVLLTRAYDRLPAVAGRRYVAPSRETEADKIDFTDPVKIAKTWDLGLEDGQAFLKNAQDRKD